MNRSVKKMSLELKSILQKEVINEEDSLKHPDRGSRKGSLKHPEGGSRKDSLTADEESVLLDVFLSFIVLRVLHAKRNSLTANKEGSLKRPERGSRKGSLTANVKGKEAFSSTFWFPEVQLRETGSSAPNGVQGKTASQQMRKTASQQMREEKKDVYNKGVRYNVHRAENSLTANKGGSKYAKFF